MKREGMQAANVVQRRIEGVMIEREAPGGWMCSAGREGVGGEGMGANANAVGGEVEGSFFSVKYDLGGRWRWVNERRVMGWEGVAKIKVRVGLWVY